MDAESGAVVTTAAQTVLDTVKRLGLGDTRDEVWPAVERLYRHCELKVSGEIADIQKMRMTSTQLQDWLVKG